VTDDLLSTVIEGAGGQALWNTLRALTVDLSIGGPIWAMNGWPPGATFDQTVTLDTVDERIEFSPFTRPDWRMTFGADTDTVGNTDTRWTTRFHPASARASFKGHLRPNVPDEPAGRGRINDTRVAALASATVANRPRTSCRGDVVMSTVHRAIWEPLRALGLRRKFGLLLGASFVGPGVAELLHSATIAVAARVPIDRLWHAASCFPQRVVGRYPVKSRWGKRPVVPNLAGSANTKRNQGDTRCY
jgi:hypothetical protein